MGLLCYPQIPLIGSGLRVECAHMMEGENHGPRPDIKPRRGDLKTLIETRGPVAYIADRLLLRSRANWIIEEVAFNKDSLAPNELVMGDEGIEEEKFTQVVLDIGAGKGHPIERILDLFPEMRLIGVDPHDQMSSPVERRLKESGKNFEYLHETVHAADLKEIPDGSVDAITLFFVLHHIDESEHDAVMAELKRVLKVDGKVFVAEDLVDTEEERVTTERVDRMLNAELLADSPHNYRNTESWQKYFVEHGFKMEKSKEVKPGKVRHGFFVLERIHDDVVEIGRE